jgi:hypothetical protein
MRAIAICLALAALLAFGVAASAADAVCVLKNFSGTVRITAADGKTRVAEPGALYEGELLSLDKGAKATLFADGDSYVLKGPLELPLSATGLAGAAKRSDTGGGGLLGMLAGLFSRLSDSGAYNSGAARGEGSDAPFMLLGPRGDVLSREWRFEPLGKAASCRLKLWALDSGGEQFTLSLETEKPFYLQGLAGEKFEYEYQTNDPQTAGGWPPVQFNLLPQNVVDEVAAALAAKNIDQLGQTLWLADRGYTYDAWLLSAEFLEQGELGVDEPLLRSLNGRLGDTLLETPAP